MPAKAVLGRHRRLAAVLLAPVLLFTAACSDDEDDDGAVAEDVAADTAVEDTATDETASDAEGDDAALCDARDDLEASVQSVRDVDVVSDGTDAFRSALADVGSALDELQASARDDLEPRLQAVRASFDDVEATVESIADQPSPGAAAAALSASVAVLGDALGELTDDLRERCPS